MEKIIEKSIEKKHLRAAFDTVVDHSIPSTSLGLGLFYLLLAISHALVLSPPLQQPMTISAAISAAVLLALRLIHSRYGLATLSVHFFAIAIAGIVLGNSLLHLYLSLEPQQTSNVLLFLVGSGYFFLSSRLFAGLVLVTWIGWGTIAWIIGPLPDLQHYGFAMASSTVLGALIHWVRIRSLSRLESLKLQIEDHNRQLEQQVEERTAELRREIDERRQTENRLQESLSEKETLLREIHHRVKNNLQIVSSLLDLQSQTTDDAQVLEPLMASRGRILTMSLVHEQMYSADNFDRIPLHDYIQRLVADVFDSYDNWPGHITLDLDLPPVNLAIEQAMPCGLIVFELVSNALKHAFPDQRQGTLRIDLHLDGDRCVLGICDDGVGLGEEFDIHQPGTLGLQLVNSLVTQLKGQIETSKAEGTKFSIAFPA